MKSYNLMVVKNYKHLHAFLRTFLLLEWDPIGIKNEPEAQDEYDSYIDGLIQLIVKEADINQIAHYLHYISQDIMGIQTHFEKSLITAHALDALIQTINSNHS